MPEYAQKRISKAANDLLKRISEELCITQIEVVELALIKYYEDMNKKQKES